MFKKLLSYCTVILGIAFVVIAIIYWLNPAGSLPAYFPGYEAGSTIVHFKHGLGSLILGLVLFVFAWFKSGSKSSN